MCSSDILCRISKGTFEIPHKISELHIERYDLHRMLDFWKLSDLTGHMTDSIMQNLIALKDLTWGIWIQIQRHIEYIRW